MKISGYNLNAASRFISQINGLTDIEREERKRVAKWKIFNYHLKNNEFYNFKLNNKIPKKWADIPIIQKKYFQKKIEYIMSRGFTSKNTYIANTSGSSGVPFFYAKDKFSHAMTWALTESRYKWYGIELNSKQARYFGRPLEKKGRYFEMFKDYILNRNTMLVFDLSDKALFKHITLFSKIKFKMIYGYANSLLLFAKFLIRNNLTLKGLCPSLEICISTSELLNFDDRQIIILGFGVHVVNEYGVSEAGGIVAFENKEKTWILSDETQFIEIVDDHGSIVPYGKEGKILITDLFNKAMPFIRYEVGDTGVLNFQESNNKLVLSKLTGRINDTIMLPSGKKSPGLTFYYISRSILESSGILKEFVIRQVAIDIFIFDIISDRNLTENEIKKIQKKMDIYLEPGLTLKINRLNTIKRPKSGKLKHFYSEINE